MGKNWYPVVNRETCIECGKCVEKCGHAVFDKSSPERPEVVLPVECVDHCHGCGGICPTGSITYFGEDTDWTPPNAKNKQTATCDCDCGQESDNKSTMKTMSIYEPAMCCPTGLCGVGIDPELLRISTVLDTLKKNGVEVNRYNLTSFPQEFVKNTKVNERLMDEGVEVLPLIVVDGKIVITKRYPTNDEFTKLLGLPNGLLGGDGPAKKKSSSSCGCGDSECC